MNFSRSNECDTQNPHSLSSPYRRIDCGDFFVLGYGDANTVFPVCIYRLQNGWDCKGTAGSLPSGFPTGVKAPFGTRFCSAKSSVLYLLRPRGAERGCCLTEHAISAHRRTGGWPVPQGRLMYGFADGESGCSGVGGAAQWKKFAKRIFETKLHHRGSRRYITLPFTAVTRLF